MSCVKGNFHAQFLEGWTGAIPSGYSVGNVRIATNGRRLSPLLLFVANSEKASVAPKCPEALSTCTSNDAR